MWHGTLHLQYCFASSIDVITPLIVPLTNLGFARHDVCLMTDEVDNLLNLPAKDDTVRRPSGMSLDSLLPQHFVQLVAIRALLYGAQPGDSFFFYCTVIRLGQSDVY